MSWVTNVILHFGSWQGQDESRVLARVNEFFHLAFGEHRAFVGAEDDGRPQYWDPAPRGFISVEDPSLPQGWYGSGKNLEGSLAIGAFNGLDIAQLVEYLCTLCAENVLDPEATQLILMDQEERKFHVINIDEEMRARGMKVLNDS